MLKDMNLTNMYKKYLSHINFKNPDLIFCDTNVGNYVCLREERDDSGVFPTVELKLTKLAINIKSEMRFPYTIPWEKMSVIRHDINIHDKSIFMESQSQKIHDYIIEIFSIDNSHVLFIKTLCVITYGEFSDYEIFLTYHYINDPTLHHNNTINNITY